MTITTNPSAAIPARPEEVAQPTTEIENVPTDLGSNGQASAAACVAQPKGAKKKKAPDFSLKYTDEQKDKLSAVKSVVLEEIARVVSDGIYGAVSYADGANAVVDIKTACQIGVQLAAADVNREHGSDEAKTGASVMKYGMQHPILIITYKMAMAAGIKVRNFKNDPNQTNDWNNLDLVLLDGHGRIDYLLSVDKDKWPQVYGVFPSPDKEGFYDIPKLMAEINVNVSKWATQDLVQKRRLEEGDEAHPGWAKIDELIKKGYKYQAACQAVTLDTDRVKAKDVNEKDGSKIFKYYDHAIKIHEALKGKFDEEILKTKGFPGEISSLWHNLLDKNGTDFATDNMLRFIDSIMDSTVSAINKAQKSNGIGKEELRKQYLNEAFVKYCSENEIQL